MVSRFTFPKLELQHHEHEIIAAVCIAGQQLVEMQLAVRETAQFEIKADSTIVTAADIASERILLNAIKRHVSYPHYVVSEEQQAILSFDPTFPTWFVDPLDGTRGYVTGSEDFAVLISEWVVGAPRFSVVLYPATNQLAVAVGGQAAWTSPDVSPQNSADAPPTGVVHMCYMHSLELQNVIIRYGAVCISNESESTRALFDVATGVARAAVVLLCGHKSWDLAPLLHLVIAAGGFVSDEAERLVRIQGSEVFGRYIIASSDALLHQQLAAALRKLDPHFSD